MEEVLKNIRDWFLAKEKYFRVFAQADTRLEGWFKAELIFLFNKLRSEKILDRFEREPKFPGPTGRKQIDFTITLNGELHLFEIKALCISQAAGTPRALHFYFREDNVGLIKDFRKLDTMPYENKWVLGFVYPNPGNNTWINEISSFPEDLRHWNCTNSPSDFPDFLFISVWKAQT